MTRLEQHDLLFFGNECELKLNEGFSLLDVAVETWNTGAQDCVIRVLNDPLHAYETVKFKLVALDTNFDLEKYNWVGSVTYYGKYYAVFQVKQ